MLRFVFSSLASFGIGDIFAILNHIQIIFSTILVIIIFFSYFTKQQHQNVALLPRECTFDTSLLLCFCYNNLSQHKERQVPGNFGDLNKHVVIMVYYTRLRRPYTSNVAHSRVKEGCPSQNHLKPTC